MTKKRNTRTARARENAVGIGLLALTAAAIILMSVLTANGTGDGADAAQYEMEATVQSPVRFSEVMSSNTSTMLMDDGALPDWIELENTGDTDFNMNGYVIMSDDDPTRMYRFSSATIPAGGYIVLYADNAGGEGHLPFRLSASGSKLTLMNAAGQAVEILQIPTLESDQVYCRDDDGDWATSYVSTPGESNRANAGLEELKAAQSTGEAAVVITEVMTRNATYAPDENGDFFDYVELTNRSDEPVSLNGWFLTDERTNIARWRFPDVTISAGESLLVHCSGYDRTDDLSHLHAGFRLSGAGTDVILTRSDGETAAMVTVPELETDQAYSLVNGQWTTALAPTPGLANTDQNAAVAAESIRANALSDVILSEIVAGTSSETPDWIELYNAGTETVDLSGWGLSDNAARPRKWQFPDGISLQPGQYAAVFCNGADTVSGGKVFASFSLSMEGGYSVTLCQPDGKIVDRVYLPKQDEDISYGRLDGQAGFFYFTQPTPLAKNAGTAYVGRAAAPQYSVTGGMYQTGDVLQVTLSAGEPNARIYYTLDSSDPTQTSTLYTEPISITGTTILRTRVYADGYLESCTDTQSYLYDVNNGDGVFVVSLVSDPDGLISEERGILVKGTNASEKYPYTGANFWQDWEREAHVEVYGGDGETLIAQNCGIKLHGQYSRAEKQQAFKVIARAKYGADRFPVNFFSKRDYTDLQSFVLRSSGQDTTKTRMRDSVLCALAEETSVLYQETEICVLYLDGQYWGQYNLRERINTESICQFEGWEGDEDAVDLVKANTNTFQGSNETFAALLAAVKKADPTSADFYTNVGKYIDIENYIEYMAIQIFVGNGDTLNVKRYRNANADGKWRWVLFDLDWAFTVDTDSINRWLTPGGMGQGQRTDNTLFIACMKNPQFRDEFLTYMGQQMATTFSTPNVVSKIQERYLILKPLLEDQLTRWNSSMDKYEKELKFLINYAEERPIKLMQYFSKTKYLNLSTKEMQHYFGEAMEVAKSYGK